MIDLKKNDFPASLETKRLNLRILRKDDVSDIYKIYSIAIGTDTHFSNLKRKVI